MSDALRPLAAVASEAYARVRATRRAQATSRSAAVRTAEPPKRRTADPNAWLGVYVDAYA